MSAATATTTDVINSILGVDDNSAVVTLRNQKPVLIEELQAYYDAIFAPEAASARAFSVADRALVAVRVASHTNSQAVADWYANVARSSGVSDESIIEARDVSVPATGQTPLGAAIRHADLLAIHTSDARASDLQAFKDAGFTPASILSLSQTIAFVSYQLRLIAGLRAFGEQS